MLHSVLSKKKGIPISLSVVPWSIRDQLQLALGFHRELTIKRERGSVGPRPRSLLNSVPIGSAAPGSLDAVFRGKFQRKTPGGSASSFAIGWS